MERWVSTILAALAVAGITALVVVYGNVGRLQSEGVGVRREVDALQRQSAVHGEAVARLEERLKCAARP